MEFTSWDAGLHREDPNSLQHYGVLGMKWGQRRYQNADGSLTAAGKRHYDETGEYGYHYKSHATKKYTRKAERAREKLKKQIKKDVTTTTDKDGVTTHRVKLSQKALKLSAKADKYANRAKRSAELDRREQEAASKISVGKALASRFLLGGDMSKAYQLHNAMAGGKAGVATKGVSAVKAAYGGTMLARAMKAAYIRDGEKDHGFVNRINRGQEKERKALSVADKEAERKKKKYLG